MTPTRSVSCARPGSATRTRSPTGLLSGVDELAAHAERLWAGFPDARLEQTGERLTGGAFVAAPCKLLGTHRAPLEGLPLRPLPRRPLRLLLRARGDRLLRVRGFFDVYDAAVQLGVLPGRGTLGEKALMMLRGFGLRSGRGPT